MLGAVPVAPRHALALLDAVLADEARALPRDLVFSVDATDPHLHVLRAVRAVGGATDATADTMLLDAGVVESIAAVELLGRLREIDAAMGEWTAELLLGEGLRVRHLLVDGGDSD